MMRYKAVCALLLVLCLGLTPATAIGSSSGEACNTAPVAENMELETYRGVSIGGQLSAYDAEGDALTFELVAEPMKGCVGLSMDGYFIYTPKENKRGKDYFSFRVIDSAGNVSQEGTVIIKLVRQKSSVTYADMSGNAAEYAAVILTEAGVFTGETLGEAYVFNPDETVTRGEFLSMCMSAADCQLLKGVSSTGFQDDADIADWLKPYVATALLSGYIQGYCVETGSVFQPERDVTLCDACVMLNAILGVTDVVSAAAYVGEDQADSSYGQAVANLTACDVMLDKWSALDASLTRGQAAQLLQRAIALMESR